MKQVLSCLLLLLVAVGGCTTKSKARAQSQAAYNAGRAAAYKQALEDQRTTIRVIGNVRNPEFPYTEEMTLMEALAQADCTDRRNPSQIAIIRHHEKIPVDVKAFLKGEDVLLEPSDTIEIHP